MNKFIKTVALFTVLFAFSAIAANAQINYGAKIRIPFAFSVSERSYSAGEYNVKLNQPVYGAAVLTIQKVDTSEVQTVLLKDIGRDRTDDVKLVFGEDADGKYLSAITTASNSYSFVRSTTPSAYAAKRKAKGEQKAKL